MRFSGQFSESLVTERLDRVSLSFLVEDLQIRRGGIAPNICFGLAALGLEPLLVGSVGEDFADYRAWLERHGVQTWPIRVSETQHTARFICTTDSVNAQIGSFYTGAMAEARQIELQPIAERAGGLDLVVISPNDPEAMFRHTDECRTRGFDFVADPSQQMAWLDGQQIKRLVDGARYLFSNDWAPCWRRTRLRSSVPRSIASTGHFSSASRRPTAERQLSRLARTWTNSGSDSSQSIGSARVEQPAGGPC